MPVYNYTAATNTFTASGHWALVQLWGGGGTGGGENRAASPRGGGGGAGEYVYGQVTTSAGTGYTVAVGQTRTGVVAGTANGNPTTFATTTLTANGGTGGAADATAGTGGGAGGTGGLGTAIVRRAGGRGGHRNLDHIHI